MLPVPLILLGLAAGAAARGAADERALSFLTARSAADPLVIALGRARRIAARHLAPGDLDDLVLRDRVRSRHGGVTYLYFGQRLGGVGVVGAHWSAAVDPAGRLVGAPPRFVRGLVASASARQPGLAPAEAVLRGAAQLGLAPGGPLERLGGEGGAARRTRFRAPGISRDPVPVELAYLPLSSGELRLVWSLLVRPPDGAHCWRLYVDAQSGALLGRHDRIWRDAYRVYAPPLESPADGSRTLERDPAHPLASPFGWHDEDGDARFERVQTSGNNARVREDANADDRGGFAPAGGGTLTFDFALDLSEEPRRYRAASITNAFYWTNWLHDLHHRYGFDEESGSFQQHAYAGGGTGGDPLLVDVQDGAGRNNARILVPPDGTPGRLELWPFDTRTVTVEHPAEIAGEYGAGRAEFGPQPGSAGPSGVVVQARDPADERGPRTDDGCSPLVNPGEVAGHFALVDRSGRCLFVDKVRNAQEAGARAVLIANHLGDRAFAMGGDGSGITIPALSLGKADADLIRSRLEAGVRVTLAGSVRDPGLDATVLAHEYGHGVSARLTGGPSSVACLDALQSRALGEGWSDWWALALTAKPGAAGPDPRGIASYLTGGHRGIRRFRYSTDPAVNPLVFSDVARSPTPHDRGEIWAGALWDLYWKLVAAHGFAPDPTPGSAGNQRALRLVTDGLRLQPCNPGFLDARDAILRADLLDHGGGERCRLWEAFAARGLGIDAVQGPAHGISVVDGFAVPAECRRCGDVDADARVDLLDGVRLARALAGAPRGLVSPEKCNVVGAADPLDADGDGLPDDCDDRDRAALRAHLAGLIPELPPVCEAAR